METFTLAYAGRGDADLSEIKIRRCRGCVKCLTAHPGRCEIDDEFTPVIQRILNSTELTIILPLEGGRIPDKVRKAVERISNVLDAYTDCGGNDPLPSSEISLRRVTIRYIGDFAERMESETERALKKGPVSDIVFVRE